MEQPRWFLRVVVTLVMSIAALVASLFLYIYWYMAVSTGLKALVARFGLDSHRLLAADTWVVILVLSVLLGVILLGLLVIFIYSQKTYQLYRLQNNFIANFTHELKTPVASLQLYLQTLQRNELDDNERSSCIRYMLFDLHRLAESIGRILNVARLESKAVKGEPARVDLLEHLRRLIDENRHHFAGGTIVVKAEGVVNLLCEIDVELFDMLVMNLIANGLTYNISARPRVEIVPRPGRKRLCLDFRDNGIGLEKRELKRIFRKFYQVGSSHKWAGQGTGLGLYLARGIARLHGGKIVAASPGPGRGAEFRLILPYKC